VPVGSAALPWWVDALLIFVAVVIAVTLIVLVVEIIRSFGTGRRTHERPVARPEVHTSS
jgi:hypothetical protein